MSVYARMALSDNCQTCTLRREGDFCALAKDPLAAFDNLGHMTVFPSDVMLVSEGQLPRGVFVICSGRAKLSVVARDGKTVILSIAEGRQLLGLSAVVTGRPSPVTATTIEPCQVKFVEGDGLRGLMERDNTVAMACTMALSREIGAAFRGVHSLLLARSSTEKLARLLLSWVANEPRNRDLRVAANFTHEEM